MQLVNLGGRYLNLDRVNEIITTASSVHLYFGKSDANHVHLQGAEAAALRDYLETIAIDVVAVKSFHDHEAAQIAAESYEPTREALRAAGLVPPSREVSPESFGELLASTVADGQMDWGGED